MVTPVHYVMNKARRTNNKVCWFWFIGCILTWNTTEVFDVSSYIWLTNGWKKLNRHNIWYLSWDEHSSGSGVFFSPSSEVSDLVLISEVLLSPAEHRHSGAANTEVTKRASEYLTMWMSAPAIKVGWNYIREMWVGHRVLKHHWVVRQKEIFTGAKHIWKWDHLNQI